MAVNLKGMNASQLLILRNDIDAQLANMAEELEKQLVQIKGITAPKRGRAPDSRPKRGPLAGRKVEPKYRNPADHSQTWAGRGHKPRWLTAALKSGKKLDGFKVTK
jgi:DNA-binding protein H-NS